MSKKKSKVLFVATSRQTMGGITSVLKRYEKMEIWNKYRCDWLETQINKGMVLKLWYMIKAYITMLFIVPRYDIVHFHTVPGNSLIVQMPVFLYSKLWRKKTIVHLHVGNQLYEYRDNKIMNFVLSNATKVVTLAMVINGYLKELYSIDGAVIYNPISKQTKRDLSNTEKFIFFAAYLIKDKGYTTLLEAFSSISRKYPDWNLVIAGTGELEEARKLCNEFGITGQVTIHNWLNRQQMDEMYEKAGIFCIASLKEGFPMSFLEAASYGVPVVCTPVGGLVDVLQDGENSMVFDFNNSKQLAQKLDVLIENEELRRTISMKLQDLVDTTFSGEAVSLQLDKLYMSL
ncbi:MAG: glycosyltransferase family 4 protein [Bacteroidales bacterium]|nr:glycosyltransferase family 4 protein [Bacteroidales bacterium]